MLKLILVRIARMLATLLAVSAITFFMLKLLPGDPINQIVPLEEIDNLELVAAKEREYNLHGSSIEQYGRWLWGAVQGDLGKAITQPKRVSEIIDDRWTITAQLALVSVFFSVLIALPIGIFSAYRQGRAEDKALSAALQTGLSIPNFVIGVFLILIFAENLKWLPATGWTRLSDSVSGNLKGVLLPALALSLANMAVFARLIRADMISTLQENYILSAKAKGMSDRFILFRHALRPSSLSVVTVIALNLGALLGGTVVIEQLFAIGGLGRQLYDAILRRDYFVVQGITVVIASVYVVLNTFVDFIYLAIDPRIRGRRH
ncbi:MAG: ABC transporter permease [Acidimicrobiales bacterium]|nr:ABC transporter permease [Acidimicrobiales bacterium]